SLLYCHTPTTEIYTLSLHDALPISAEVDLLARPVLLDLGRDAVGGGSRLAVDQGEGVAGGDTGVGGGRAGHHLGDGDADGGGSRSEEHTSELQSRFDLVCRLLLEKK